MKNILWCIFFSLFCFICNGLKTIHNFFWVTTTYVTSDVILIILFPNSCPLSFIKYLWQLDEDKGKGSSSTGIDQDCFWTFRRRGKCGAAVKCVNVVRAGLRYFGALSETFKLSFFYCLNIYCILLTLYKIFLFKFYFSCLLRCKIIN